MTKSRKNLSGVLGQLKFDGKPAIEKKGEGVLTERQSTLNNLVSGSTSAVFQQKIDPKRCTLWSGNGRDYEALSEAACRDLIDSLISQGKQEIPAIVRKRDGDPDHDFELIVGFRRHWSISWLRDNGYPDFQFLVEVRELTDEAAFRLADIENRSRADITDYERAKSYLEALALHYDNNQSRMAKRLEVSTSWLSRYLGLARLPQQVVKAFANQSELNFYVARELSPLLQRQYSRGEILVEADRIIEDQKQAPVKGSDVLKRLVAAGTGEGAKKAKPRTARIKPVMIQSMKKELVISLDKSAELNISRVLAEIEKTLREAKLANWQ